MAEIEERSFVHGPTKELEDSYIIGDIIGRGSYSVICKCLLKGKMERACRIYKKENLKVEKVKNQLEAILKINHPHIIHTYDAFETKSELRLICELIKGGQLFERIVECGHYSEREASKAIKCILSALECLHNAGIVHGDIRPESLLYQSERPDAPLKLRDVSFSKATPTNYSAIYMAPENQCLKGDRTEEDIWSLGVVLYIMLCGLEPSDSICAIKICGFSLPCWDEISESGKELLRLMLEENPEKRLVATEALNHSWVNGVSTKLNHMETTVERLKEFNARHKFRAATKAVMATQRLCIHHHIMGEVNNKK